MQRRKRGKKGIAFHVLRLGTLHKLIVENITDNREEADHLERNNEAKWREGCNNEAGYHYDDEGDEVTADNTARRVGAPHSDRRICSSEYVYITS